jgi:hypothetical protein
MEKHKQYRKQQVIEKDLQGNNLLLQKYDTCRALALKLVISIPLLPFSQRSSVQRPQTIQKKENNLAELCIRTKI